MPAIDSTRYRLITLLVIVGLLVFMLIPFVLLTMMKKHSYEVLPVEIQDTFQVENTTGTSFETSSSIFMFSATADLEFSNPGYNTERLTLHKTDTHTEHVIELMPLPGYLDILVSDEFPVIVTIDQSPVQSLEKIELTEGTYTVSVLRNEFLLTSIDVDIEGRGVAQVIEFDLAGYQSSLSVSVTPRSAEIVLNGNQIGVGEYYGGVPVGQHNLNISSTGYASQSIEFTSEVDVGANFNDIVLKPLPVSASISTKPTGASLLLDGQFVGESNMVMHLQPGRSYLLVAKKPGFADRQLTLSPNIGQNISRQIDFEQNAIKVSVEITPPGTVFINGTARGNSPLTLDLYSNDTIAAASPGHVTQFQRVDITKGEQQAFAFTLYPPQQHALKFSPRHKTVLGTIRLERFPALAYTRAIGAENPQNIRIQITRPFYMSTTEITEQEFGKFLTTAASQSNLPKGNVSWTQAARFCNWLSAQDSLQPVYVFNSSGLLQSVNTNSTGYRLPTEAEWETAAGFDWRTREVVTPYEWGTANYAPVGIGNLAGEESSAMTNRQLPGFMDNHASSSPVGSYQPNFNNMFDMTGNVAEWVHDYASAKRAPSPPPDYTGPPSGFSHVVKGSSYLTDDLKEVRIDYRNAIPRRNPSIGFRIAQWLY